MLKVANLYRGGSLGKNEKSKLRGKGDKEIEFRIDASIPTQRLIERCLINRNSLPVLGKDAKGRSPAERNVPGKISIVDDPETSCLQESRNYTLRAFRSLFVISLAYTFFIRAARSRGPAQNISGSSANRSLSEYTLN
jgi:hypothetical protein